MKLIKFLFLAVAIVSLTACSSDDDSPEVFELNNANVAGTYDVVFLASNVTISTQVSGNTVNIGTVVVTGDTFTNATFTFNSNGTYSSSGGYVLRTTTTITGQSPVSTEEVETFDEEGTYSINAANNTITIDGIAGDVTLFNNTNLRVVSDEVEVEDGNTFTAISEIRFVRQN